MTAIPLISWLLDYWLSLVRISFCLVRIPSLTNNFICFYFFFSSFTSSFLFFLSSAVSFFFTGITFGFIATFSILESLTAVGFLSFLGFFWNSSTMLRFSWTLLKLKLLLTMVSWELEDSSEVSEETSDSYPCSSLLAIASLSSWVNG
jgi:hypothetical protein